MKPSDRRPCRSCPAEIYWLENMNTGKRAPIDARATHDGNIEIDLESESYRVLSGVELAEARAIGVALHKNHFATCPAADSWKRRNTRGVVRA